MSRPLSAAEELLSSWDKPEPEPVDERDEYGRPRTATAGGTPPSDGVDHWDLRFLQLAKHIAAWSKDPSTKVGAVIVDGDRRIVSVGFNGFPRDVPDDHRLLDREVKYEMVVHAEINAILFAGRPVEGCTLYVWPLPPCSRCAAVVIQSGIYRVVAPAPPPHWVANCQLAAAMFAEADVVLNTIELPETIQ